MSLPIAIFVLGLLITMVIFLELGRRAGVKRIERGLKQAPQGVGIVEAAFLGLFSLLLAFSFSGAVNRYDHRRDLIVDEINDIGTAYLRVNLLPPDAQPKMRCIISGVSRIAIVDISQLS